MGKVTLPKVKRRQRKNAKIVFCPRKCPIYYTKRPKCSSSVSLSPRYILLEAKVKSQGQRRENA